MTTSTPSSLDQDLRNTEVDEATRKSLEFRQAVYCFRMIWGIFNNGSSIPDARKLGEFCRAIEMLSLRFPFPIELFSSDTEITTGWIERVRVEAELEDQAYLRDFDFLFPGDIDRNCEADEASDILFISCFISYCMAMDCTRTDQAAVLTARQDDAIRRLIDQRYLVANSVAGGTLNAERYRTAFKFMRSLAGGLHLPSPPK